MNNTQTNAPKIKRETKNKIKVDFERTNWFTRFRLKYLTWTSLGKYFVSFFKFMLLLGISFVILYPFYTKISTSFMSKADFVDVTVKLIPKRPTLDTYKQVIIQKNYLKALLNTTTLSVTCAFLQTFVCSLIGYGFAKYKFKGSKLFFMLVVLTMIIPHDTLNLSMYMKFRYFDFGFGKEGLLSLFGVKAINLTKSFWPMIVLSLGGLAFKNGLYIFMMRQFFRGVPDELEESAYIDGYGPIRTFFKIIVPISIPMMITIFLFAFAWQWTDNAYVTNFQITRYVHLLNGIVGVPGSINTDGFAGADLYRAAIYNTEALLIIAPLLIVYLFCQRYLVQGIERSGIVG